MLKSEFKNFSAHFPTVDKYITSTFGSHDISLSALVSELHYFGDDEIIECMHATLSVTAEHADTKIIFEVEASRDVYGNELGHFEVTHQPSKISIFTPAKIEIIDNKNSCTPYGNSPDDEFMKLSVISLFSMLPCSNEKMMKFRGLKSIQ